MLRSRKAVFVALKLTSRRRLPIRLAGSVVFLALAGVLCWSQGLINSAHLSPNTCQDVITGCVSSVETSAIKVHEGRETITRYVGDEQLQTTLTHNAALARSLTSGDFNEDGMPDLVAA